MKKRFYENVRENTLALERAQNAKRTRFILARTVVFPVMLVVLIHGYDMGSAAEMMLGGFLLLLFMVLVARHRKLERLRLLTKAYLAVTAGYLMRFSGEWKSLSEDGAVYGKEKRPPDRDLHIFGTASLYQYLCAARTQAGRERLPPRHSRQRRVISNGRGGGRRRWQSSSHILCSASNWRRAGRVCRMGTIRGNSRRSWHILSMDR